MVNLYVRELMRPRGTSSPPSYTEWRYMGQFDDATMAYNAAASMNYIIHGDMNHDRHLIVNSGPIKFR